MTLSDSEDGEDEPANGDQSSNEAGPGSPSARRRPHGDADEGPESETTNGEEAAPTYLVQQPPCITGGTLRPYQLEGLNWMINLQSQGTNGARGKVNCVGSGVKKGGSV